MRFVIHSFSYSFNKIYWALTICKEQCLESQGYKDTGPVPEAFMFYYRDRTCT